LQEKGKSEKLLLNILPDSVAYNLKKKKKIGTIVSEKHPDVTLLVADIVGFTEISSSTPPKEIVSLLNQLFSSFDDLCSMYGIEKIKTIGLNNIWQKR
jgi:class 3 adenylate cyclase